MLIYQGVALIERYRWCHLVGAHVTRVGFEVSSLKPGWIGFVGLWSFCKQSPTSSGKGSREARRLHTRGSMYLRYCMLQWQHQCQWQRPRQLQEQEAAGGSGLRMSLTRQLGQKSSDKSISRENSSTSIFHSVKHYQKILCEITCAIYSVWVGTL